MRFSLLVACLPLTLLAACGGDPQTSSSNLTVTTPNAIAGKEKAAVGPVDEPSRLKGLNSTQVKAVLGKPVFTRRDAPAEIWQYRARACTLDLFLYDEGNSQTVAHYAVRGPQPVGEQDCFNELVSRKVGTPTS